MTNRNADNLVQTVRDAGVVGAGGAGFPAYKKIDTNAKVVIANGVECEPLLFKDQAIMQHHAAEMLDGLQLLMRNVGAERGVVAIKAKNRPAIDALAPHLPEHVSLLEMADVYPAGDEYEVVYHASGRRIPAGGYPTEIGVLVQNVETIINVHRATQGSPVTHSMMTIHGHVARPYTAWLPIGMSFGDALELAGGTTIDDFVMLEDGPMMGGATFDLATPVTRTSSGITVMACDAMLGIRKVQPEQASKRVGKSACDQCCLCTEMCPRYLLGYHIQPHRVMRSLVVSGSDSESLVHWALGCSECNVCSLWACPEGLDPRAICVAAKKTLSDRDSLLKPEELRSLMKDVHRLRSYRSVPTARLVRKLGLSGFTASAPLQSFEYAPEHVAIPVQQHIGEPAVPVVSQGDRVSVGEVIARAADEGLSVPVHASIAGTVHSVGERIDIIR